MKKRLLIIIAILSSVASFSQITKINSLNLPDTLKAISLLTAVKPTIDDHENKASIGIQTSDATLIFMYDHKKKSVMFSVPFADNLVSKGLGTLTNSNSSISWTFDWDSKETYKLYITTASDSAANFIVYSGYVYFPITNKWKLIGSYKINGQWSGIKTPSVYFKAQKSSLSDAVFTSSWFQSESGAWKKLSNDNSIAPLLPPFSDLDSTSQASIDKSIITNAIKNGQIDAVNIKEGVYYNLMKKVSKGNQVQVTDTVTVYYKGYVLGSKIVFDETIDEPRTFPLSRLIRGWQLGLNGLKVGEKIKLLIPSGVGYSIKTRSAKIPPNSILVFEIEIVSTKPRKN